jgi:hypothetical protein
MRWSSLARSLSLFTIPDESAVIPIVAITVITQNATLKPPPPLPLLLAIC